MKRHSKWQDKHLRKLEALVHNSDFQNDLKSLPKLDDSDSFNFSLYKLTEKYDLPLSAAGIIYHYLATGDLSPEVVHSSMKIICDDDHTSGPTTDIEFARYNYTTHRGFPPLGIEVFIPPGTSQIEATSFIQDNWGYIESKIGKPERIRRKTAAKRNAEIVALYKAGLSNREIVEKLLHKYPAALTPDDIATIIRKNK